MNKVRTRIAPSPTGQDLHIGNAYTALINFVFAKKHSGQFIVRIEDTDRSRLVDGSEQRILKSLQWLGLAPQESPEVGGPFAPYRQSERLPVYKKYAEQLVKEGNAYYCFCTAERLAEMREDQEKRHLPPMYDGLCKAIRLQQSEIRIKSGEPHVIRLNVPDDGVTKFTDLIRGEISFENKLIDDQVLLKSDGFPTYHLGVVVDDHLMEISHIIRGEEWISSTPKHILLYQFFGWTPPVFAHMPLLRNPDKSKLSKRKNPVWVSWYKEQGFLPEAVLNYLATLAWAHPEGKDIFSVEEMMQVFELKDVQTTAPIFDIEKLKWMNKQYIIKKKPDDYVSFVSTASQYSGNPRFSSIVAGTAVWTQPRISVASEYDSIARVYFDVPHKFEKPINKEWLTRLKEFFINVEMDKYKIEQGIRVYAESNEINPRDLFMELRIALTGSSVGPPLIEAIIFNGREKTLKQLDNALEKAESWSLPKSQR